MKVVASQNQEGISLLVLIFPSEYGNRTVSQKTGGYIRKGVWRNSSKTKPILRKLPNDRILLQNKKGHLTASGLQYIMKIKKGAAGRRSAP